MRRPPSRSPHRLSVALRGAAGVRCLVWSGVLALLGTTLMVVMWQPRRAVGAAAATATSSPVRASFALPADTVESRFAAPPGFDRLLVERGSFGAYLRSLPLKPQGALVRLHDGSAKRRQDVHAAVVDLDVGVRDLQQCADAVMRLRAEHLASSGRAGEVAFHFTNGFLCSFATWRRGFRPRVVENAVSWTPDPANDGSAPSLRRFLDVVFTYAGTRSLPRDLVRAGEAPVEPGDVFLQAGSPGHAVIVVDVAVRGDSRAFLLAQSYMPAQDIHVVRNLRDPGASPWYRFAVGDHLVTPEWTFRWRDRMRFPR